MPRPRFLYATKHNRTDKRSTTRELIVDGEIWLGAAISQRLPDVSSLSPRGGILSLRYASRSSISSGSAECGSPLT